MTKFNKLLMIVVAAVGLYAGAASALPSNQILVLTTATRVDTANFGYRSGVVIRNGGPNTIYCRIGSTTGLAVGYGFDVLPGGTWSFPLPAQLPVYCLSAVANQLAGAATEVVEF